MNHSHRGDEEDPAQSREGNLAHRSGRREDDGQQDQGVDNRCQPGATTGTDIDRSASDRAGRRHAAEE